MIVGTSTTAVATTTTTDNRTEEHHHHQSEQQPQHQYQPQYLSSPQQHQRHMIHSPSSVSSISSTDSLPVVATTTTEQNKRSYHTAFHHSPPSSSTSQQQQLPHGGGEIRPPLPKHLMTQQQRIPSGNSHSNVPRSMPFHDTHSPAPLFPPPPRRIYGSSLDHANSNSLFPLPPISALQSQVPHQQNSPTNDVVVQQPYQHDYHHHESSPEVGPPLVKRFKYAQIPPPLAPLVRRNQQQSQQQQSSAPGGPPSHPPPPYHNTPPSSHAQQSYYSQQQQQHASAHSYAQSQHSPPPYNHNLHRTQQQSPQMIRHGNDNKSHYHYQQQQQLPLPLPSSHIPLPYNHNKSSSHSHPTSLPSMSSSPSFYQHQHQQHQQQQQQQYSAPVSSHQQSPSQRTSNYSPQYMNNNNNSSSSSSHHHHHHQQHQQQQQQHLSSLSNTTTKNQLYPPLVIHHANNNNNNNRKQPPPPPFVLSSVPEFTVPPKPVNMTRIISQNHNVSEALMALATKSSSSSPSSHHHHPHHSHNNNNNNNHRSNNNSSQRTKQRETTNSSYHHHHQQRETDASSSSSSSTLLKPTVASLDEISRKRSHALLAPLISTQHSSVFYRILSFISPMDAVGGILLTSKLFHMIAYHRMLFSSVSRSKNGTVEVRNNDVVAVKALQHAIRYGHVVLLQKLLTNSSISPYACYDSYHFAVIHRGERDYMAELFLQDGRMQQYLESEDSAAATASANSATSGAVMNHSNSQVHSQYSEDGSGAVNMTGERQGTDLDHHETIMTDMKSGDHHRNYHNEENAEENGGDDDAFAAAVSLYRFQMPEPVESKKYFYTMKRKVPSSQSQIDVVNYLVQERLNMVMTLTKLKPNKGAKSSPTGLYWEVANMIIPDQQTTPPTPTAGMLGRASYMGADQGTLVIRSGNKGTNDNGSHNRIRYALYFRVPIDLLTAQQGVIDPTNIQFDYDQFAVMARRCDNFEYEDREKVLIDKQTMFKCLVGENQYEYFMYMALRFDISQNASKSLKHTLQVFYKNVSLVESSRCKFVSGRGNPNCILSKKSHSEERNVPCYMIKEVPTTK